MCQGPKCVPPPRHPAQTNHPWISFTWCPFALAASSPDPAPILIPGGAVARRGINPRTHAKATPRPPKRQSHVGGGAPSGYQQADAGGISTPGLGIRGRGRVRRPSHPTHHSASTQPNTSPAHNTHRSAAHSRVAIAIAIATIPLLPHSKPVAHHHTKSSRPNPPPIAPTQPPLSSCISSKHTPSLCLGLPTHSPRIASSERIS
jgi:hypothetical protein